VKATKLGAFDFVEKPLSLEKTLLVLRNALRQRRLEKRNRVLLAQLTRDTEILGESEAARRVRREAAVAAASDAPVLICGEAGSGRETVARHVHTMSRRSEQAFVHVPCGTSPALEPARVQLADRGTLFLEDVDAMPPEMQAVVSGWLSGDLDVRLIGTASPDPAGLRSPLRERLDVIRIATAPLRERREDISFLAARFMRDFAGEYGRPEKTLSAEALAALRRHDWPGNVRELRNVVERLLLLAPAEDIGAADLPTELGGAAVLSEDLYAPFPSLAEGLAAFARYYLKRAVRDEQGDIEAAARRAGISAAELRKRIG
jgi:two-component system nitrogen regulation response regulator NtrX